MNVHRSINCVFQLGSRYPQQVARVRVGVGVWLLLLTAIMYGSGHGGQWGWLLAVAAALHFGLAYRLFLIARRRSDRPIRIQ
jgi:membrane protease YdiL (CAAX protease family)